MNLLLSILLCSLPAAAIQVGFGDAPAKERGKSKVSVEKDAKLRDIVSIGKGAVVAEGEVVKGVVVIGGSAEIRGEVRESVIVVGGSLDLDGPVGKEIIVVLGKAELGPRARVAGNAAVIGSPLEADPAARIEGERRQIAIGDLGEKLGLSLGWLREWVNEGLLKLRLIPHRSGWAWAMALFMLLGYAAVGAAAPGPVEAAVRALDRQPVTAFLVGLLVYSLAGPLSLMFAVSIFGLLLLPALAGLLFAASLLGRAAVFERIGAQLGLSGLGALLAGGALCTLTQAVPGIGLPLWLLIGAWGMGAATLAAVELVRAETARPAPPAAAGDPPEFPPAPAAEPPVPAAAEPDRLGLPRAGFWLRAGAIAIDVVAVGVLAALTPFLTFGLLAWAVYQVALWTWKGTTFGGIVCGIRGVRVDGRPMDLTVAAVRHLASYFSAFAGFLGFFWAAWDPERQTWHDKIAGTVVVRVPRTEPLV